MNEYRNEFESNGILAVSVLKYMSFGIFLFQLSMCRMFIIIIKGDLFVASLIVICAELFFLIFYQSFEIPDVKEILSLNEEEVVVVSSSDDRNGEGQQQQQELTPTQIEILKKAYLHPFEKYERRRKAI